MAILQSTLDTSAIDQLTCARRVVDILFEATGLQSIIRTAPGVIVGGGNWISFTLHEPLSPDCVLALRETDGAPAFISDIFDRQKSVRSRTSPSLHLTNLGSGENLVGHVDAYYWATNPLGHADEFLTKRTAAPSELLKRLLFHQSPAV